MRDEKPFITSPLFIIQKNSFSYSKNKRLTPPVKKLIRILCFSISSIKIFLISKTLDLTANMTNISTGRIIPPEEFPPILSRSTQPDLMTIQTNQTSKKDQIQYANILKLKKYSDSILRVPSKSVVMLHAEPNIT